MLPVKVASLRYPRLILSVSVDNIHLNPHVDDIHLNLPCWFLKPTFVMLNFYRQETAMQSGTRESEKRVAATPASIKMLQNEGYKVAPRPSSGGYPLVMSTVCY